MNRVLFFVFFAFVCFKSYSQIYIANKGLESIKCQSYCGGTYDSLEICSQTCRLDSFMICEQWFGVFLDGDTNNTLPSKSFFGNNYIGLGGGTNTNWQGSISQKLPCALKVGKRYIGSIAAARPFVYLPNGQPRLHDNAGFTIWGNNDSCSRTETLWKSPLLDTMWETYNFIFTPSSDYLYFQLRVSYYKEANLNSFYTFVFLDSLSDIYPLDGGAISIAVHDTSIAKGQCIRLSAQPSISTYDTVLWYQVVDSTLLPVGIGLSPSVCPTTHSTYIVAMRDSVPDCAGIWWSYDTVRVWIDTTVGIREVPYTARLAVQLYPNPTQGQVQVELLLDRQLLKERAMLTLYDALGRAVFEKEIYNEEVLSLPKIAAGVYSVAIRVKEHSWRGKLWVEE
jgi:hypothetical protein